MNRAGIILGHLNGVTQRTGRLLGKDGVFTSTLSVSTVPVAGSKPRRRPKPVFMENDDDVVIVSALRTPICKSKRGGFKVRNAYSVPHGLVRIARWLSSKYQTPRPRLLENVPCVLTIILLKE